GFLRGKFGHVLVAGDAADFCFAKSEKVERNLARLLFGPHGNGCAELHGLRRQAALGVAGLKTDVAGQLRFALRRVSRNGELDGPGNWLFVEALGGQTSGKWGL